MICVGYFRRQLKDDLQKRSLEYNIIKGWANAKDLPSIEKWRPIMGEPIVKGKKLSKKQSAKVTAFNEYILSGKWKKQNG